jgi:hypothetical protein
MNATAAQATPHRAAVPNLDRRVRASDRLNTRCSGKTSLDPSSIERNLLTAIRCPSVRAVHLDNLPWRQGDFQRLRCFRNC